MSGLLAVKLRRDLRATWPRFALMVLAIAVSLTAVGGVLFAWATSGRETSSAYLSTEPASATVLLDEGIDAEQMAAIAAQVRRQPGVIETTGRTQFVSEIEVDGQPRDIPLQVFAAAPDDPMRLAKFDVGQQGSWPPSPGEIFIGVDSLTLLGVAVGDTVTIEPPGGKPVRLRVAETVYDPSLSPSPQEQRGHGYLSTEALAPPAGTATLDQLKLQVSDPGQAAPSRDRDRIVAVASDIARWLQERGMAVREVQVPRPYAHPHQWQTDVLLGSLLAGGAAALLLSTILVAVMLNNLFTQQIPQIGILKAVGARSVRVGGFYLAMALLVAAAATVLALGPAVWLGRDLASRNLEILGIQPASLTPAPWTYAAVIAVGLLLPPLLALVPLVKTSLITVRAAIDHRGLGSARVATGVLTRLSRIRNLDRGLLMALRNTIRRPARFWLSVGLLAAAGMVFVAGMSLSAGTQAIAEEDKAQGTWDVDVRLARPTPVDDVAATAGQVPGVSRIDAFNVQSVGLAGPGQLPVTRTYPDQGHGRVTVTAIPAETTTFPPPRLQEGRWLGPGETGAVVVNDNVRDNTVPGLRAGDTVDLLIGGQPTTWRVVGISGQREGGMYTTAEGLAEATGAPPLANQLRIVTDRHDEPTRQAVASAVHTALTDAGLEVDTATSISRREAITAGHLGPVLLVLLGVALPLGVVGVIGLAATMSANVLDRIREFGVLHAIGARPKAVRRIVVAEAVFLALASCLVAILPTLALTWMLGVGLGNLFGNTPLPYRVSLPAAFIWVAVAVLGAVLATEAAAARAARLTVREALAYL